MQEEFGFDDDFPASKDLSVVGMRVGETRNVKVRAEDDAVLQMYLIVERIR